MLRVFLNSRWRFLFLFLFFLLMNPTMDGGVRVASRSPIVDLEAYLIDKRARRRMDEP